MDEKELKQYLSALVLEFATKMNEIETDIYLKSEEDEDDEKDWFEEFTGLNRKEFCEQFDIPYRTVTEWELGHRNAPPYVFRFLEYYIRMQELMKEKGVEKNIR